MALPNEALRHQILQIQNFIPIEVEDINFRYLSIGGHHVIQIDELVVINTILRGIDSPEANLASEIVMIAINDHANPDIDHLVGSVLPIGGDADNAMSTPLPSPIPHTEEAATYLPSSATPLPSYSMTNITTTIVSTIPVISELGVMQAMGRLDDHC